MRTSWIPVRALLSPLLLGGLGLVLGLGLLWRAGPAAAQAGPGPAGLELLSPRAPQPSTPREFIHILGRTQAGAQVRVAGEPVTVYATGVFARDRVPLALGANSLVIEAVLVNGQKLSQTLTVERLAPPAAVVWPATGLYLDGSSLRPALAQQLAPGEAVEVALRATPGQRVEARLPGQGWQPLAEAESGRYRGLLAFAGAEDVEPGAVAVRLSGLSPQASLGASSAPEAASAANAIVALTTGLVGQWRDNPERLVVVGRDGAELQQGLHEVRLGGPYLAELPAGTLLTVTGRSGARLRVRLAPDTSAWVADSAVSPAAPGTAAPYATFTSMAVAGGAEGDVVSIPLSSPVPYAVRWLEDSSGRQQLEVRIFGSHHATTWITHRASARVVREVSAEPGGAGQVRVLITPLAARLWGWKTERTATALRITLRAAPALANPGSPLMGLKVALEAGHGSAENLGAVGATGVPEKDVNRWATEALKAELESRGAQVVMVRESDDNPTLRERSRRAVASDADLFLAVHANAADTAQGFLRTSGTSTYYKNGSGRDLAAAVQRRQLQETGLPDFGLIGSFNYTPLRLVTWMPAILVEQAFMTHPGDEAQMLDPAFRVTMARAVRLGVEDFLRPKN